MKKVREGYKMTEIGEIPEEWSIVKLGSVIKSCSNGLSDKQNREGKGVRVTRIETISNGIIDINKVGYVETERDLTDYKLHTGDILFSNINSVEHIGKVAYVDKDYNLYHGMNLLRIRSDKDKIYDKYLYFLLCSYNARKYFRDNCKKAVNQASLNQEDLKRFVFALPSFTEQKKIAQILSTVDELIEKTDEIIEKTKELKKGLMQKLLTKGIGHSKFKMTEIGEIPEDWEVRRLDELADVIMGQSPDSSTYNDVGEGIPFFQGKADFGTTYPTVRKWCIQPTKISEPLDILLSVRAPVGDVNINNVKACIGRGLAAIRAKRENDFKFIYYALQQYKDIFDKVSQGSTFSAINSGELKALKLASPNKNEQRQIASILSAVDEKIEAEEKRKEQLLQLKKGLMQQLLTGRVRVKV
ncbi:restriction endonuclease subunit S [Fonticella tunisiensis]|uniref:Type I restriction enzyme S subunit n=1 Tax=Fonticella tunisiensis TaxID=1096341 RepID=A0A4R7KE34_9CLOT|nr:restriction endonuclease subunit S [Fonticella tunisiensis]TDT51313.1 type I restriction enzyme S subunit [Fonticella tunisiensis]